ncbi:MAG: glycosyltransferase family 4 protein [Abditibacteriales bacterium]|nr:glycosyltransferase family 4 protein [Abditibacteriales bacterium]MDW8365901.1 glycosyltransferase family 4 protein [Abditibacteriales bacterium]
MPKILRIIARLNIGGPAIHVSLLSAGLNHGRYRTTLVAGSIGKREGDMSDLAASYGVRPVFVPELGREIGLKDDVRALKQLMRLMRREKPDIVHTHTAKAGTLGRLAAMAAGVPVKVHTFHGHVFHGYFGPRKTRIFLAIERFLARRTDRVIVLSEQQAHEIADVYQVAPREKISVIPLGFDLDGFLSAEQHRGQLRAELRVPSDGFIITIVGRLVPVKNHRLFFEMARRVAADLPQAHFVVVGDGELRPALQEEAASLRDRVHFLGWRRDLPVIYADSDVVVLTSVNEGTPVALIEAMASGVPVVATRVGGVPDIVRDGETGIVVEPNDADALTAAVRGLLRDAAQREKLGAAGRPFVRERFDQGRLLADVTRLYDELLARP